MLKDFDKVAPLKFKGSAEKIPLSSIINYISFTCVLFIEYGKNTGALYFKNGKLTDVRIENEYNLKKADELLNIKKGTFSYTKIENEISIELKQLKDILYILELADFNAEVNIPVKGQNSKILFSEGVIVSIEPKKENYETFLLDLLEENEGNFTIKLTGGQTGNLKLYFNEVINGKKNSKQIIKPCNVNTTSLTEEIHLNSYQINIKIIEESFKYLTDTLKGSFTGGSLYTSTLGKPLYQYNTETNQSVLFSKLHKNINQLLKSSNFNIISEYYLLDLEGDYTVFILTFKEHHYGLVFKSSKFKLGYFLNIIKPTIIQYYEKAIKQTLSYSSN